MPKSKSTTMESNNNNSQYKLCISLEHNGQWRNAFSRSQKQVSDMLRIRSRCAMMFAHFQANRKQIAHFQLYLSLIKCRWRGSRTGLVKRGCNHIQFVLEMWSYKHYLPSPTLLRFSTSRSGWSRVGLYFTRRCFAYFLQHSYKLFDRVQERNCNLWRTSMPSWFLQITDRNRPCAICLPVFDLPACLPNFLLQWHLLTKQPKILVASNTN